MVRTSGLVPCGGGFCPNGATLSIFTLSAPRLVQSIGHNVRLSVVLFVCDIA